MASARAFSVIHSRAKWGSSPEFIWSRLVNASGSIYVFFTTALAFVLAGKGEGRGAALAGSGCGWCGASFTATAGGSAPLQHTFGEFCRASKTCGMPVCGSSSLFPMSLSSILCIITCSVSVTPRIALGQWMRLQLQSTHTRKMCEKSQ